MKLNLGCGNKKRKGYLNCDISEEVHPDKIIDLRKRLPFKEDSIEEVYLSHILEHFLEPLRILKEIYRVCENSAKVIIRVPFFSHESAFSMLDHKHFFSWTSFDALEKGHKCHWQSVGNFRILRKKLIWRKSLKIFEIFFNITPFFTRVYQEFFCWIFPAKEVYIELEVIKEGYGKD